MPRKSKALKPAPATGSGQPPSEDSTLPAEVLQPPGSRSALDRASERDQLELLGLIRKELGASGGMATFRRRNPSFGQSGFQALGVQLPAKEVTPENLALMYGGGDFEIRFRSTDGTFDRQVAISIDHSIKPKNPLSTPEEKKESPQQVDVAGIMREFRESMPKQNDSALVEMFKAVMIRPEPKGETAALVEMIKEMREEARRAEDRFMKMMQAMNDRHQSEAPRSLVEQVRELREISEELGLGADNGRPQKEESFGKEVGRGLLEAAKPLLAQYFGGGAPGTNGPVASQRLTQPVAVPSPSPSPTPTAAPATSAETGAAQTAAHPTEDMNPMFNYALKQFQTATIKEARKGDAADAFGLVGGMIAMVPDNMHALVFKTANQSDWFTAIFGTMPEAMNYTKFIGEVREAILEQAFVFHCQTDCAMAPRVEAEQTARDFIGWVDAGFRDYLVGIAEDDDDWSAAFDGAPIDAAWLAQVRASIPQILAPEEEPAKVVPMTPAPSTNARNGAPAGARKVTKAK